VGFLTISRVGIGDCSMLGLFVGLKVASYRVGDEVGRLEGSLIGELLGAGDGLPVGLLVSVVVGVPVGLIFFTVGRELDSTVG